MGSHLGGRYSWGAPGQIADLARMPAIVCRALPWLRIDPRRIYAVGGSMGGQETLLLLARYPRLLAGAVAVDAVADFPLQYRNIARRGHGPWLQRLVRREVGGTPSSSPTAFAARSPLAYAGPIARSRIPLQIWWTRTDRVVLEPQLQSGLLVRRIRQADAQAPLSVVVGSWRHTAVLRWDRSLPTMLEGLMLLPSLGPDQPVTGP
jgi:pimeloyl-ACP methyl ester carboxylesterase